MRTCYDVLHEVVKERQRQEELKAAGKFRMTCADPISNLLRYAILGEEFGEVGTECLRASGDEPGFVDPALARQNLRKELIQVAAVAVAWVEGLDAEARCQTFLDGRGSGDGIGM